MTPASDSPAKMAGELTPVATPAGAPARKGPGAPKGNRNRITSGVHSFILGRFPAGGTWVARQCHWLRRALRREITTRDGATSLYVESVITSACVHEGRRLLLARWLRLEGDKLPVLDRANLLDRIGKASDARDNCLRLLKLDIQAPSADPWESLAAPTLAQGHSPGPAFIPAAADAARGLFGSLTEGNA